MPGTRDAMRIMAIELRAVGTYQNDQACANTLWGEKLKQAADLLDEAADNICDQGYYGCRVKGCTSEHR